MEAKRAVSKAVFSAQSETRKRLIEDLHSADGKGSLFSLVKRMKRENKDVIGGSFMRNEEGAVATNEDEVKQIWKDYYDWLLNEEFEWDKDSLERNHAVFGPIQEISEAEVKASLDQTKSGKAAGPSGVVSDLLKAAGDTGVR